MVNQHHPFAPGAEQVVPGQNAHDLLIFVQDGVAVLPVFEHQLLDLVHPVLEVEAHQILRPADPAHGGGLEDEPGRGVGVEGGGDDAGGGGEAAQLLVQLRLTQHQAVHVHFQRPADHVRLVAAEHHGVGAVEQQVLPALGQGDGHVAADGVGALSGLVEKLSLQHRQHIEKRHRLQKAGADQLHVVACHILPGQHTVQGAVLVGNRQGGDILLVLQKLPGPVLGDGGAEHRRGVEVQVLDLGEHIADPLGGLEAEAV